MANEDKIKDLKAFLEKVENTSRRMRLGELSTSDGIYEVGKMFNLKPSDDWAHSVELNLIYDNAKTMFYTCGDSLMDCGFDVSKNSKN